MSDKIYLQVEPKSFRVPVGQWLNQEISFINILPETYRDLVISIRPPLQIDLKQSRYILKLLDPGVSQTITLKARLQAKPGESFPLQLTVQIDDKPPQKINLSVVGEPVDESSVGEPVDVLQPKKVPINVSDFEQELNKLSTPELESLCRNEMFDSIYNSLVGAQIMNSDRVGKIIDYCKRRKRFPKLHQALKDILKEDYTFFDKDLN